MVVCELGLGVEVEARRLEDIDDSQGEGNAEEEIDCADDAVEESGVDPDDGMDQ